MSTPDITIYYHAYSQPSRSIRLLSRHFGFFDKITWVFVDLVKGEHLKPEFLALNPAHSVPTLHDKTNNIVLIESCAILQYLADVFKLDGEWGIPQDFATKHKVQNALAQHPNLIRKTTMTFFGCWMKTFFAGAPWDNEQYLKDVETGIGQYKLLETILERNNGWLAGVPSIADVHAFPEVFQLTKTEGDFTVGIFDFAQYPAIRAWLDKCKAVWFKEDDEDWGITKVVVGMTHEKMPQIKLL